MTEKEDYSLHYGLWHNESEEHARSEMKSWQDLLGPYLPPIDAFILDIGCGMGCLLWALRQMGYRRILGVEKDEGMYEVCRKRGLPVVLTEDTLSFLEGCPEKFDLILMIDVLEHIDPSESVPLMRAVHSALRPAGRLVARVPNAASPFGGFWRYQDYTHKTAFTHISLSYLLRNAGFSKISVVGEGSVIRRPPPLTRPRRFIKWLIYAGMIACYRIAFMESMGNKEPLINTPFSLNVIAVGQKHGA